MEKPNKHDLKYRIRTGNNINVNYEIDYKLYCEDLEYWIENKNKTSRISHIEIIDLLKSVIENYNAAGMDNAIDSGVIGILEFLNNKN